MYIESIPTNETKDFFSVFHKGSDKLGEDGNGLYGPNNSPGVYLYKGKRNLSDDNLSQAFIHILDENVTLVEKKSDFS